MKILLMMLLSTQAFAYQYKVQKEDNLSTILNSIGEYQTGDLKKEILHHTDLNELDSPDLIEEDSTLNLHPAFHKRILHCNISGNDHITFKKKYVSSDKPFCKQRVNFTFLTGRKTYKLNSSSSFEGYLSTDSFKGYEISIDILSDRNKNSLKLYHSLHDQDYKSLNSMTYNRDSHILPTFGLSFMENNNFASPFISLMIGKEVFLSQEDVNTLSLEDKFVTSLNLGYQLQFNKLKLSPSARLSSHDRGANLEADYSLNKTFSLMLRGEYQKRDTQEERGLTFIGLRLKD